MWYLIQQTADVSFWQTPNSVTIRGVLAALTAFFLGLIIGPTFIKMLKSMQFLEDTDKVASEELRKQASKKKNTPTMGGIMIVFCWLVATLAWADLNNRYILWAILACLGFSMVGFLDDFVKANTSEKGLNSRAKTLLMLIIGIALAVVMWRSVRGNPDLTSLYIPFFLNWQIDLSMGGGILFLLFATLVIMGSSNAVNLTDGMDGLAIGCTIIVSAAFAVIAYITGRKDFADHLMITHIPGASELAICCAALAGAGLAFLWFNCFPASMFMGDCGSLMLGGFLGYVAVALRQELLLFVLGGMFVLEAVSVMMQVTYFKLTKGKRIFRCAPIHYHFKLGGLEETKVVMRFWIVEILLALMAIAMLLVTRFGL